jgi:hypothetical protein
LESQNFFGAGVGLDGPVPEGGFVPVPVDADTLAPAGSVSELTAQLMEQARLRGRLPSEIERARMFGLEAVEGPYREAISKSNMPVDFTNWDERTRLLDETEKGILEQAAVNLDLSQVTRDEMKLRLQQIGLQEDEANNLLGRIGLQEEGLDIAGQRLDLAEADINESINYLNQTLLDVDLDEASLDRNLATIADQITLTDLQKDDIGFQRDDLSSLDEISSTLLAARESLLGEETGIGGERIDVERQRLALEEESTELQSDRAMKAALRDSYARGASFTTGIREDVADLNQASRLALDELALRNTGLDLADRELLATSGYQQAEIDAARRRAEVDLQSNMRVLDLDESELGFVADRLGRSAADVADAITRLDTDRLAIQLQISEQSNALESLGLDRDEIANQLESLGYDRADVGLTLKSYELQRGALGLESKRNAAEDTLKQLAIDRSLREVDSARLGFEQSQKEFDHAYTQWEELNKATEAYETGKLNLYTGEGGILEQQAGYGATQAMTEAIQQWAPVLSGLTRGEYDQLSGLASQIPGLDIAPTGAASEPEMMFVPGGPTIDFHPEIVIPDTMYPSPEIPGGGYDPGGGGDPGGGDPGGEDDGLPGGFLPDPFDPGGGGDPGGEDDGFVPDYPGDVPDPPAGDDGSWTPPGYEDLPGGFLPDPFDPGGGGDPPAGFDPEAFGDYDFGSEFGGLFNAAPQPTGFTMDPGARRATRELGDQLPQSDDFATALLNELGAPVRANNLETIGDWIAAEGTTAAFNPLATTKQGGNPGDANRDQYDQFNSVGVKNYPDFATGVDRTAATLRDSFALPVLEGLMANVPAEVMNTDHLVNKALSTWSGGGYTEFPSIATPGPRYGPPGR